MCLNSRDLIGPCSQLDVCCCSLQQWCCEWSVHSSAACSECAGKCSPAASPVMCAVGHNQTAQELLGLEPSPIYSGFLALTRPPSRLQQTLLCPYRLFPMGQKREMFVRDWPSHKQGAGEDARHKAGVEICWTTCGNLRKELRLSGDRSETTPGTKRLHPHSGRKHQRV